VAVSAAVGLMPASWRRAVSQGTRVGSPQEHAVGQAATGPGVTAARARWVCYLIAGGLAAGLAGQFIVVVLVGCGMAELLVRRPPGGTDAARGSRAVRTPRGAGAWLGPLVLRAGAAAGGLLSVAWVALKVGALSFGGGFVIIPLMQQDAVHTYRWMTGAQFLSAVALGQVTPGPVVQTVAVVGYAAAGVGGGLLAAVIAFAPSFVFVLAGGRHFDAFRASLRAQAFLGGAGPAAIGAIAGASVTLGLELSHVWQIVVLAAALGWLLGLRRGVVAAIVGAAGIGVVVALAGGIG
jgi:chromate transporter